MPEMDKFVDFWDGIWERKEQTPYMPWMEEIGRKLHQKVNSVNDFTMTFDKVKEEVAKEKGGQPQELMAFRIIGGKSSSQLKKHSQEHSPN